MLTPKAAAECAWALITRARAALQQHFGDAMAVGAQVHGRHGGDVQGGGQPRRLQARLAAAPPALHPHKSLALLAAGALA